MNNRASWPDYLLRRAARQPPAECGVVDGSTPVVSFGHPLSASVATLGINPSSGEFLDRNGTLLDGAERRLATLDSLGVADYAELDDSLAAMIVDDCAAYFERRPYRWFTPLDGILRASLGVSYFEASACHLDLVQWATDPLWGKLSDVAQARLLTDDRPFLSEQLQAEHYRVVVVNGRTALDWVSRAGIVKWQEVGRLTGPPTARLYVGDVGAPLFLGWSCNLQSQQGAMRHVDALTDFLKTRGKVAKMQATGTAEDERTLARGTHARTTTELTTLLADWLAQCSEDTIGDVSRYPRAPWVSVETPLGLMDLNADTRRSAVEAFLVHARRGDGSFVLHVVANRRGRINKVVFDPDVTPPVGWYAYLRKEQPEPTSMTFT